MVAAILIENSIKELFSENYCVSISNIEQIVN